jgi:hypothetical protein
MEVQALESVEVGVVVVVHDHTVVILGVVVIFSVVVVASSSPSVMVHVAAVVGPPPPAPVGSLEQWQSFSGQSGGRDWQDPLHQASETCGWRDLQVIVDSS